MSLVGQGQGRVNAEMKRAVGSLAKVAIGEGLKTVYPYAERAVRRVFSGKKRKKSGKPSRKAPRVVSRGKFTPMTEMVRRVRDIKCKLDATTGVAYRTKRDIGRVASSANAIGWVDAASFPIKFNTDDAEEDLSFLQYYDPSNPGTLIVADGDSGLYNRRFCFDFVKSVLTVRNNYQVPCQVRLYTFLVKSDTNLTPIGCMNQIGDIPGNQSLTQFATRPSQVPLLQQLWRQYRLKTKTLWPGQSMSISYTCPRFEYDPQTTDTHADKYQKRAKSFAFLIGVSGVLGHSTDASQVGGLPGGVDWIITRKSKITYDAGSNIIVRNVSDNSDTILGAVVSNKPESAQQGFSA